MRSFAFLLLLAVVFLLGLLIGVDRDNKVENDIQTAADFTEVIIKDDIIEEPKESHVILVDASVDSSEHITQKAASFLESGVKVFYDVIVEVLYQISSLVF